MCYKNEENSRFKVGVFWDNWTEGEELAYKVSDRTRLRFFKMQKDGRFNVLKTHPKRRAGQLSGLLPLEDVTRSGRYDLKDVLEVSYDTQYGIQDFFYDMETGKVTVTRPKGSITLLRKCAHVIDVSCLLRYGSADVLCCLKLTEKLKRSLIKNFEGLVPDSDGSSEYEYSMERLLIKYTGREDIFNFLDT